MLEAQQYIPLMGYAILYALGEAQCSGKKIKSNGIQHVSPKG